jgi:hypothetical protein
VLGTRARPEVGQVALDELGERHRLALDYVEAHTLHVALADDLVGAHLRDAMVRAQRLAVPLTVRTRPREYPLRRSVAALHASQRTSAQHST